METKKMPDVILVKHSFTNEKRVPKGIPLKEKEKVEGLSTKELQRGMQNPGSYERVREKRVDTGRHTQIRNVNLQEFTKEIESHGYKLVDCHYFKKVKKQVGHSGNFIIVDSFVVVTGYSHSAEKIHFLPETLKGVEQLTSIPWGICHLWQNPAENGKTIWTANLMHVLPEAVQTKPLSFKRWLS